MCPFVGGVAIYFVFVISVFVGAVAFVALGIVDVVEAGVVNPIFGSRLLVRGRCLQGLRRVRCRQSV